MKLTPLATTILLLLSFSVHAQTVSPDDGAVKNGLYFNSFFSFGYRYPKDWNVTDEAINDRIRERAKEEAAKSGTSAEQKNAYLLFTLTRYPRGTPGIKLNPTILILAEKIAGVPGKPNGKDFLLDLRPLNEKRGMRPLLDAPVEFRVADFQFFRDDYGGEVQGVYMRKSIFVTVRRGFALGFSFAAEDQKTVDEMAESMKTVLPLGMGGGEFPKRPN